MKKLLRNRRGLGGGGGGGGLVESGGPLRKRGVSKLFHQFSFRKACFHYYWIFFLSGKYSLVVINRSILSMTLFFLFARK